METNIGIIDRTIRIVVGLALLIWAFAGGPWWAYIGVLPLFTGWMRWCPAYSIFGFNTCQSGK